MIYHNVGEIYAALDKTRGKLLAKAAELSDEKTQARESADGWSVAEILEHMGIVEGSITGIIEKFLAEAENAGRVSDGTFDPPVSFLEQARAAAGQRMAAPERVHPKGGQSLAESLKVLEANRRRLLELRPRIEAADLSDVMFPHPAFGKLNLYQWIIVVGLHERRHLEQIERALTK